MLRDCQLRAGYRRRAMGVSRVGSYVIPREAIADRAQLQRPEHGRLAAWTATDWLAAVTDRCELLDDELIAEARRDGVVLVELDEWSDSGSCPKFGSIGRLIDEAGGSN